MLETKRKQTQYVLSNQYGKPRVVLDHEEPAVEIPLDKNAQRLLLLLLRHLESVKRGEPKVIKDMRASGFKFETTTEEEGLLKPEDRNLI